MIATNISDFRANIKQYVDNVLEDGGPVFINRGNTAAVLISLDEYNSVRETRYLMNSQTDSREVAAGVSALTSGIGIAVDIDEL